MTKAELAGNNMKHATSMSSPPSPLSFPRKRETSPSVFFSPLVKGEVERGSGFRLVGRNDKEFGFSTVEMLIAFLVVILSITAVVGVVFGSQSVGIDTETNQEAQLLALGKLEDARALSREDFDLVNDTATTTIAVSGLNYNHRSRVTTISDCAKQVRSQILWTNEIRPQNVKVSTTVTSPGKAAEVGWDCSSTAADDAWKNPDTLSTQEIQPSGNQGTDLDVIKRDGHTYAFLTSKKPPTSEPDFWIVDVTSPASTFLTIDPVIEPDQGLETGPGLVKIDVAKNNATGRWYAYVANYDSVDQLQIIDVTDVTAPFVVPCAVCTLPGVAGADPQGRSIFFYNDRVYIGTHRTAGHEFHIYDVSDPTSPVWLGSRELNHNINDIMVRDDLAYLATSGDAQELTVLDVSNPASIQPPFVFGVPDLWRFDAPGTQDGTSLYLIGNKVYLGRARGTSSEHDFFVLDVSNPTVSIPSLGSVWLDMNPSGAKVEAIVIIGNLAFIGTSDSGEEFQVWNIANPASILNCSKYNFPEAATGLDFVDNLVYSSVKSNNALRIIFDNPP